MMWRLRLAGEVVSQDGRILRLAEQRGVGVVFQALALWPHLTVGGNLAFGLGSHKMARGERADRVGAMLARVGLLGKEGSYSGELSGGERQRVAREVPVQLDGASLSSVGPSLQVGRRS